MTERESWVPSNCGRCGIFVGMPLKSEGNRATQEKSLVGFCEWREGLVWGGETPPQNCGCIDVPFLWEVGGEIKRRGLGRKAIKEIDERLETVMLQRAGIFEGR